MTVLWEVRKVQEAGRSRVSPNLVPLSRYIVSYRSGWEECLSEVYVKLKLSFVLTRLSFA